MGTAGLEQGAPARRRLAAQSWFGAVRPVGNFLLAGMGLGLSCILPTWAMDPAPLGDESPASESTTETSLMQELKAPQVAADPMGGDAKKSPGSSSTLEKTQEEPEKRKLPPITPDLANLNLAEDLELVTLDTHEKVYLPAGTYRQILRIPIDSPTIHSAQKTRLERRPEVRVAPLLPPTEGPEKKPLWIRYESLEKIKINDEERRGGLDLPINGPSHLKARLWYAKSETADAASSVFYFIFGGLGYSTANLLGWSAGNTREIPGDFEYRLIRR